jgi:acyl carrier protein
VESKEIIDYVNHIMIEGFEIEEDLLKPEALLGEDLGLDSLDAVDLVVAIEKKFGFRIQEQDARSMRTLKDIYDYIEKKVQELKEGGGP